MILEVAKANLTTSTPNALPDSTGPPEPTLGGDLLQGAIAIAEFMFGAEAGSKERRRVYWLAEIGELPVFYIGSTICARKSTIMRDVAQREARAAELSTQA